MPLSFPSILSRDYENRRWILSPLKLFDSHLAKASRSDSDDLPVFLVTTHPYALLSLNRLDTMALNLVMDTVFE
ncbi:hypothetical protein HanRHA438_Chr09g0429091 [Helianthus annuus]|nr:hypothetical protein HanRHA438_Chr09g0429091 [Helianthus annuus]